ncbi:cysteine methyltransferase [Bacillus canaveralius]|uniref:Methylated-DNA--protein-cysteine methyltransferase n=1 Tax=Bacillus canaveralius TaxID=1403243 RepID=A0A2N5GL16_9BACI|nr:MULTISPECIES: methylated-DNA--[protein]-cysteine S-methyltransferase [Bacillus]PLR82148.1 cysteine methyltransferase [Bacillus canaveralius]PLR83976.1 cysteine methyltransferase [Bacillus sp. V33-4]PLR97946.1 cysteine methyltransferase [Bacillus canaveralius]
MNRQYTRLQTVIGLLFIVAENGKLSAVHIGKEDFDKHETGEDLSENPHNPVLAAAVTQLGEYFSGTRSSFQLPLDITGTDFQQAVWKQLEAIPFGVTKSYQDIASTIGKAKAVRAVGQANKANKFPIIIPCHRVIGQNKTLTGYAGTRTDIKEKLLRHEKASFKGSVST